MYHSAKIIRSALASPSVMLLDLQVSASSFSFSPGQWVDFVVPPHDWTGGFSIASSPRDLPLLRLAVKRSNHPPAAWVHENLPSDSTIPVEISVGGACTLLQDENGNIAQRPSYFIAGGIGISPILSQYREFLHYRDNVISDYSSDKRPKTSFLYSVSTTEELVFGEELIEMSRPGSRTGLDQMIFTLTKEGSNWEDDSQSMAHVEQRFGRHLHNFLTMARNDAVYYVCGPSSMIDETIHVLKDKKVCEENIIYEKWW